MKLIDLLEIRVISHSHDHVQCITSEKGILGPYLTYTVSQYLPNAKLHYQIEEQAWD